MFSGEPWYGYLFPESARVFVASGRGSGSDSHEDSGFGPIREGQVGLGYCVFITLVYITMLRHQTRNNASLFGIPIALIHCRANSSV